MSPHNARHSEYVNIGYCPSIHSSKAWCNGLDGHHGKHFALRLLPDKRFVMGTEWEADGEWR